MAVNSLNGYGSAVTQRLVAMRGEMEDLQRQLGTRRVATSYAGLGTEVGTAVDLRSTIQAIDARTTRSDVVSVRLEVASTTLSRISSLVDETRTTFDPSSFDRLTDGRTLQQTAARGALDELLSLLGTDVDGRQLFGGKVTDAEPVETMGHILDGDGTRAGLRQLTAERREADLGTDGRGRLTVGGSGTAVSVAEDGNHPFGFKLAGVASTLSGATVTGPGGSPPGLTVDLATQPAPGGTLSLDLALPDGTQTSLKLTAGAINDAAAGTFAIGSTPAETAANLRIVLGGMLESAGSGTLTAASAMVASRGFFTTDGSLPQRVDGPPFATATALRPSAAGETVAWYMGDSSPTTPRDDATVKIEGGLVIRYGLRANEPAFAEVAAGLGALAVSGTLGTDDDAKAQHAALVSRARDALAEPPGKPSARMIAIEIGNAHAALERGSERDATTKAALEGVLDGIEAADPNEVAVRLLALQTQLQASYEATSILHRLSLTQYL